MKKPFIFLFALVLSFSIMGTANATLIDNGYGMIYDSDLNITWLQDANYSKTSGYSATGQMTWQQAMTWAQTLSYDGITGWRLPTQDPAHQDARTGPPFYKLNEMGYLRTAELGNQGILVTTGPFINVMAGGYSSDAYWYGTEASTTTAYRLLWDCG